MKKKNANAVKLGSLGGKKTAANMTPEQLKERGRKAIAKRWEAKKDEQAKS